MANWVLWHFFLAVTSSLSMVLADDLTLVVGSSSALQIVPGVPVVDSPGSKPGLIVGAERVQIHGLSRLKGLKKFLYSIKVKVSTVNSTIRQPTVEVCFHRNATLGIAMCPQGQWEKLSEGSWVRTMSPFDHKVLDVRMASSPQPLEITITEEFFAHRPLVLVLGTLLLMFAPSWSKSLVFYYSSAMAVGIILVILMVLFKGMKLLRTGRHKSFLIFIYSSLVGVGSFFLSYMPKLLHMLLAEIGISEDMFYPLAIFLFLFIALAGAWLGFGAVRKLVLTEVGSIHSSISQFVTWLKNDGEEMLEGRNDVRPSTFRGCYREPTYETREFDSKQLETNIDMMVEQGHTNQLVDVPSAEVLELRHRCAMLSQEVARLHQVMTYGGITIDPHSNEYTL